MASVDHERLFSSLDKTTSSNRIDLLSSSCSENLTEVGNRKNRPENPQDEMYDVFLSFHGGDTALAFTDNLFWTLKDHKVNVFIDNNQPRIEASMPLPDEVNQAIKGSRMAVIVFSSTYIDSSTCCLELVNIMELYRRRRGPIVLPIFYDLDPSAVKAGRIGAETWGKPLGWRKALTEAADLAGAQVLSTADGYEGKFIREIVHKITRELKIRNIDVTIHQVGIDSRVQEISNDLDVRGSDDVRIIGIWGMGGLGKTEVAKAIFNKYHHSFDGKSFLQNVREKKLIDLQDQLLFDILKRPNIDVSTVDERTNEIEKRLGNTKVLVIFDDIDHVEQLDALAIKRDSFGVGSRIIITTRDAHLLKILKVDKICPVPTMNEEEALELLSWHAFGNRCPPEEYLELSREVVDKCGGLPLALQSVGSFLFRKSSSVWGSKLDKLKRDSCGEIHENLKISYDKLSDDDVRAIFLDISCFFIGMNKDYVMRILKGCDFYPEIGIRELHDRCLVTVDTEGNLMMHDLIRDLGRDIVRAESPGNSGKQSRLWHLEDVTDVLRKESGTEEIEGLALSLQESDEPGFSTEAFRQMQRLRLLKLNYVKLTGSYMHIPTELRWLCWHGFSLEVIPEDFDQPNLVSIDLSYSKLIRVWVDSHELLENLKFLNLSHSINLERTPDFSKLPNLEELILEGCESLPEVHSSIGGLERLALINLEHCKVLKDLPPNFYNSKSIETLLLNGCSKFEQLAEGLGAMVSLTTLEADNTAIRQIPSSIVKLKNLRVLSLCGVKGSPSTKLLPPYLRGLDSLRELALAGCNLTDDAIPEDLGSLTSLEDLDLENNSFWRLPSFSGLSKLELLCINGCANLRAIPDLPTNLKVLQAMCCTALETMPDFSEMSNVRELYLSDSFKLTAIPGFDKSLNSMTMIHMEGCTNLTTDFRKNIIQEWTSCGYGGIFLDANYIPECFEFVDGDLVDFYVPQSAGRTFKGVTLCCVYSANKQPQDLLGITVTNNTKRVALHAWITYPLLPTSCEREDDYLWQGQLSNDLFNLQGGDEVEIFIGPARTADESVRVKKIGVNPVWDRLIKENKHDSDLHLYDFDPHPKWLLEADDKQDLAIRSEENKHDSDLHLYDFDPHPKWLLGADDKQDLAIRSEENKHDLDRHLYDFVPHLNCLLGADDKLDLAKMKSADGFNWRKYGQKQVRGSENPRSYYRCTFPNCPAKKKVERSLDGQITEIVYKGNHNHPKPQNTRRSTSNSSHVIQASNPNTDEIFPDQSSANHGNSQMDSIGNPENLSILMGDDEFEQSSPESKSGGGGDEFDEADEADEANEPNAKRWKKEIADNEGISAPGSRKVREPRVVVQTTSDVDIQDDGYSWRKYGHKTVKGNPNPRSYYKCTYLKCPARKHVERASHDLRTVITTYEGKHNHDVSATRGSRGHAAVNRPLPTTKSEHPPPPLPGLYQATTTAASWNLIPEATIEDLILGMRGASSTAAARPLPSNNNISVLEFKP